MQHDIDPSILPASLVPVCQDPVRKLDSGLDGAHKPHLLADLVDIFVFRVSQQQIRLVGIGGSNFGDIFAIVIHIVRGRRSDLGGRGW